MAAKFEVVTHMNSPRMGYKFKAVAPQVGFTHHSSIAPRFDGDVRAFWVDFATGDGLQEAFDALGRVDVVINTAAISAPLQCQKNPEAAR